ncbi:MAG: cob(I)yrinic acid a,c-diamide adenosyltransferase [Actinobacteria bacterium]|nr:cob(I)yrinic acid a,c-diamide adenosyltransferase [Actinomycetota bacterium]
MTIRINRVTTRGGDHGETSLADASRVPKTHDRIEAIGAVDELNSAIGVASDSVTDPEVDALLGEIQHQLFDLGADLATPVAGPKGRLLGEDAVLWLEDVTARYNESLPPLDSFILPGGPNGSAALQLTRAIARRAERRVVAIDGDIGEAGRYLNRLSDVLFVLGRAVAQGGEKLWQPHTRS